MANSRAKFVTLAFPALGTAKTVGFRAAFTGQILSIGFGFEAAVDATNVVQVEINEVDVTGGGVSLTAALSAVGKTLVLRPTALNTFTEGAFISIDTDGGGTVGDCHVTFALEES